MINAKVSMILLKLSDWRQLPLVARLLLTVLMIALALLFSLLIWDVQLERTPYLFAWLAGMAVIWCWNLPAGILAAALSATLIEALAIERSPLFSQISGINIAFFGAAMLGTYVLLRWRRKMAAEAERALSQLRLSEQRFRIMADTAPCLIWVAGKDKQTTFFNRSWLDFTGSTLAESLEHDGMNAVHPEDYQRVVAIFNQHFAARQLYEQEYRLRRHDGVYRWMLERAAPLFESDGAFGGYVGSCVDITERKQQEVEREELLRLAQEAQRAAEEASHLKINFLGMISHELSTPMTSIKGFADTLLATDVTWDADQQREFLEIIRKDSERMMELISHLLDLSRLEAGRLSVEAQPFNLDESLDMVLLQLAAITAQHRFRADIPPDLPLVRGDARRVAQIFLNLVGNAARYSPADTAITLNTTLENDRVRVDVSDEGPGIPAEMRQAVFEAFRQLEAPGLGKGAGLGLAICKRLVEAQGGAIWVQERQPPGTTISFTLPLA